MPRPKHHRLEDSEQGVDSEPFCFLLAIKVRGEAQSAVHNLADCGVSSFTEVLEFRRLRIREVADGGVHDGRIGRVRIGQERLALVAPDVAEDAAVLGALEEPGGAVGLAEAVGSEADDLDDAADGAAGDEVRVVEGPGWEERAAARSG